MNVPPEKTGRNEPRTRRGSKLAREIGAELRQARLEAGLSQAALGKKLTTGKGTAIEGTKISSYERGEYIPEPRLRPQYAAALGVSEAKLFAALLPGADGQTLASRLDRVESEMKTLRKRLDSQEALLAADEADRSVRESRKGEGRSGGRQTPKDDQG